MEAIVFIIVQFFFAMDAVLKIGRYSWMSPSFSWGIFGHVTCLDQSDYNAQYIAQCIKGYTQESVGEASVKCPCNHRLYWSIYTSVIISTKYRSRHWFLIGQLSVKYRSNVDWVMTDISTDTSAKMSIKAPHKMHDPFSLILYHHDIIIFHNFFVILYSILGEPLVCQRISNFVLPSLK